ncbi:MAG: dUTP diphosphatase [Halobacteriovoraceae bacterium]|nr:dUTP diphosphatase [Halobacteriovoraceae bacterium]|tara:strand:- start:2202 stop:2663 length:462 start_codon:yes stop_codon:yes gene_type:complete
MIVSVKKLDHFDESVATIPHFQTEGAAGSDIHACFENKKGIQIRPFEKILVSTGLCFSFPKGFEIQVRPRSGLSLKSPLIIPNSPGTIDSDYRGELKVIMMNLSNENYFIEHGLRVAQLVFSEYVTPDFKVVKNLDSTIRSDQGFGSTGKGIL